MEKSVALFCCKNISKKFEKVCKNLLTNAKIYVIISHAQQSEERKEILKMKKFMVKFTSDFGKTFHTELVSAKDFTDAYLQIYLKLPLNDSTAITDLIEII